MGHLTHSADVRASRNDKIVPFMMDRDIEAAVSPIREELREQHKLIVAHVQALAPLTTRIKASLFEISAAVTGDANVADYGYETDAPETDEEELGDHEEAVFKDLDGDFVLVAKEASLRDTSMIGPTR
uniref:Polyprotein protein n=1 Tax=Solanum tuberosum TaxID=4113 RepID=M1DFU1_SOLTU